MVGVKQKDTSFKIFHLHGWNCFSEILKWVVRRLKCFFFFKSQIIRLLLCMTEASNKLSNYAKGTGLWRWWHKKKSRENFHCFWIEMNMEGGTKQCSWLKIWIWKLIEKEELIGWFLTNFSIFFLTWKHFWMKSVIYNAIFGWN